MSDTLIILKTSGGSVTGNISGEVVNFSALPVPTTVPNQYWRTLNPETTGTWIQNLVGAGRKPEGIYQSVAGVWDYVGEFPYEASQVEVDAGTDTTKFVTSKTLKDASQWGTKYDTSNPANYQNATQVVSAITTHEAASNPHSQYYLSSNPSSFETTSQLNTRDTNNRSRTNHTGTQTASTISDFATTTLNTVLTGLGLFTNTTILATDTILASLAKLQGQINSKANTSGQIFTGTISATNLSGTNSGDETTGTIQTKRPLKTVNGNSLEGSGDIIISGGGSGLTFTESLRIITILNN